MLAKHSYHKNLLLQSDNFASVNEYLFLNFRIWKINWSKKNILQKKLVLKTKKSFDTVDKFSGSFLHFFLLISSFQLK
jgi:hypothetical protein